jgi:DNA polymerase-3 subunit delta'
MLPATVISRCQKLDLRPASLRTVESLLHEREVPEEKAQLLARLSAGRIGWALTVQENESLLQQRDQDLDKKLELLAGTRVERMDFAWNTSRDQARVARLLELWTSWWRDLLLVSGEGSEHIANIDRLGELEPLAQGSSLPQVWAGLQAMQTAVAQIDANVNVRLALESLLLKLPHWPQASASRGT